MTFLKSLWRKLFPVKTIIKSIFTDSGQAPVFEYSKAKRIGCIAYDPSQDEHKIMSGEVESYFE